MKDRLKMGVFLASFTLLASGCSGVLNYDMARINGTAYASPQPKASKSFQKEVGKATYYANKYHGRKTASGERFDQTSYTAAHKTLPFGTKLRVTNVDNGESVIVRVNDRGPFKKGRVIDLSSSAFGRIAQLKTGVINVSIEEID